MKKLYVFVPMLLLCISLGAQLNIQNLVNFVDCPTYACVYSAIQPKGFLFADSTFDVDFKTSRYTFQHKPLLSASEAATTLVLQYDQMDGETMIHFETVTEADYRALVNDITAAGFVLYQTFRAGGAIYINTATRLTISVETDTYADGPHYGFTVNYKPAELE